MPEYTVIMHLLALWQDTPFNLYNMNVIKVKLTIFIKGCICFSCLSLILLLGSCQKDPYVSKDVIQRMRDSASAANSVENVCFVYNNDVYFFDNFNNAPQKITNTPANTKTEIRISHNLQKIAYINAAGNPEIIDRSGNILNTLTQYSNIKQMDWSISDSTLYMLIGNQFQYYGPIIHHPLFSFNGFPIENVYGIQILSATLSRDNDLAYVVEYNDTWNGGLQQKLILKKNDGNDSEVIMSNNYYPNRMEYAKFSNHAKDLAVTVGFGKVVHLFTNLQQYPDLTFEDRFYQYPIYRSDKNCIMSRSKGNISSSNSIILSAFFMEDGIYNNKPTYNYDSLSLRFDWK